MAGPNCGVATMSVADDLFASRRVEHWIDDNANTKRHVALTNVFRDRNRVHFGSYGMPRKKIQQTTNGNTESLKPHCISRGDELVSCGLPIPWYFGDV